MKDLLPIGRFAQVCRLTVKALRHCDELGLLHPTAVDQDSGYRYYALAQAADAVPGCTLGGDPGHPSPAGYG